MIWKVKLKDGTELKEYENGNENILENILPDTIDTVTLTETGNNMAVPFSSDSGIIKFTNLDLSKILEVPNGKELKLVYNDKLQTFVMDKESVEFYNSLVLRDNPYFSISFDQTGKFKVNNQDFHMGFNMNGELVEFINQGPYNDLIQYKNGLTDFLIRKDKPVKKIDATIAYSIGYKCKHTHNINNEKVEFDLSYTLTYNLMNKSVELDFLMTSSKSVRGSLFMYLGDKQSGLPVDLIAGQRTQTKRIITITG